MVLFCEVDPAGLPILEGTDTHRTGPDPAHKLSSEKLTSVWWLSRGGTSALPGGWGWEVDGIAQPRRSLVSWDHKGRKRGQAGAGGAGMEGSTGAKACRPRQA